MANPRRKKRQSRRPRREAGARQAPEATRNPFAVVVWTPPPERPRTRAEIVFAICERMVSGELTDEAARNEGIAYITLWKWTQADPELGKAYMRAREESAAALEHEALRVAHTYTPMVRGYQFDPRLLIDTLKWAAAKRRPKVYNDQQTVVVLERDPREMTDEELAQKTKEARSRLKLVS